MIIIYNSEGARVGDSPVLLPGALAVNPLSWSTDAAIAGSNANLGARFFDDATGELIEEIPEFAAAHVDADKGVLVAIDMKTPGSERIDLVHMGRWPQGAFHRFDYAFWYGDLEANVNDRIGAYQREQGRL